MAPYRRDGTHLSGPVFQSDAKSNSSFYNYGAEVLAVADGTVSDLKDGFPDNAGSTERNTRAITLDNIVGNYLTLNIGQGHSPFMRTCNQAA